MSRRLHRFHTLVEELFDAPTFSQITARSPKRIHALNGKGLLLKTTLFIIAFTFDAITGQVETWVNDVSGW